MGLATEVTLIAKSCRLWLRSVGGRGPARQDLDRHHVEGTGMGGAENDLRGAAGLVGLEPARRAQAPAIACIQAGEAPVGTRGREVVADALREVEKLRSQDDANRVAAEILGAGGAAAVPVEARHWVGRARKQLASDDVDVGLHG